MEDLSRERGRNEQSTAGSLENSYGPETMSHSHGPEVVPQPSHGPELAYYQHMANAAPELALEQQNANGYYAPTYSKDEQSGDDKTDKDKPKKRIIGLPATLFWVLVGGGLVAVGVALGLGLGLGLRKSTDTGPAPTSTSGVGGDALSTTTSAPQSSSSSSTSTGTDSTSSTSSAPVTSGTVGLADNSCTSSRPSTYYSSKGNQAFTKYCATDWPQGIGAFDGNGTVNDLYRDIVYTFEACMDLCLNYNNNRNSGATLCNAVTYNSNLTRSIAGQNANCFLKDKRGLDMSATAETASAVRID